MSCIIQRRLLVVPSLALMLAAAWGQAGKAADPAARSTKASEHVVIGHKEVDMTDKVIPLEWLDKARALKVLFNHMSIGANVLGEAAYRGMGLVTLSEEQPARYAFRLHARPPLNIFDHNNGVAGFFAGRNGDAASKALEFEERMSAGFGTRVDVAMMKLCYADFPRAAMAEGNFKIYSDSMARVAKAFPKVRLVWWTVPVTVERAPNNIDRWNYNQLIREECEKNGHMLFDIADIEAHDPKGVHQGNAQEREFLFAGYKGDGNHMNRTGADRAARAFWWMLARAAGWDGKVAKKK